MAYLAGLIAGVVSFLAFTLVVAIAQPGIVTGLPPGRRESWILWALTIVADLRAGGRGVRRLLPTLPAAGQPERRRSPPGSQGEDRQGTSAPLTG